jgi:hypothetical protein
MEYSVYPRACRSEEWHEETMNCLQCGRERSVVDIYDRPTISTTKIPKNLDHCTASDLDANRMIGIVCTASYTRHTPPSPPRKTLVGAQRLVCTPTASRRQHQTHCRVSLRHYCAKYSASPFPSPVHIAILYYSYRRCKSPSHSRHVKLHYCAGLTSSSTRFPSQQRHEPRCRPTLRSPAHSRQDTAAPDRARQ